MSRVVRLLAQIYDPIWRSIIFFLIKILKQLFCNKSNNYSLTDNTCKSCSKNCQSCDNENNCLYCIEGFLPRAEQDHMTCYSCSEFQPGFFTDLDGNCREICGDGINLGFFECDDGNLINGDGCSSICTLEKNFACSRQIGGPDVCGDSTAPSGILQVLRGNQLRVRFSERVRLTDNMLQLQESIKLQLIGAKCNIEFKLDLTQKKERTFYLYIHTVIPCSISGKNEYFTLAFHNLELIKDLSNNFLSIENQGTNQGEYQLQVQKLILLTLLHNGCLSTSFMRVKALPNHYISKEGELYIPNITCFQSQENVLFFQQLG